MDDYDDESEFGIDEGEFDMVEMDFDDEPDESEDDELDEIAGEYLAEDDEFEDELAEYRRGRRRGRRGRRGRSYGRRFGRRPTSRARPRRSYAGNSRGRRSAIIRTPAGNARVRLPGGIPTMSQFRKTSAAIQKDIKRNSLGIKQLEKAQKALGSIAKGVDKSLDRKVFGLQLAVLALSVISLPQARALIESFTSNSA